VLSLIRLLSVEVVLGVVGGRRGGGGVGGVPPSFGAVVCWVGFSCSEAVGPPYVAGSVGGGEWAYSPPLKDGDDVVCLPRVVWFWAFAAQVAYGRCGPY
jgi:hypothetical protein